MKDDDTNFCILIPYNLEKCGTAISNYLKMYCIRLEYFNMFEIISYLLDFIKSMRQ